MQKGGLGGIREAHERLPPLRPEAGGRVSRAERGLILLVSLHSVAVGAVLSLFPRFGLAFAGFGEAIPTFFPRQAGVFHLVLAFGYLLEHFRYRGILLLLFAKGAAAVLLLSVATTSDVPWAVPFSGVADGLMGAAVWAVHRLETGGGEDRERSR